MSHSPYILPSNGTLHPTGPIPDTYCISTLACNINPTIPHNIIQKFPANSSGLILAPPSTSVASFLFPFALQLLPHINITVLVNGPTHWPCPLCTISPSNIPNWTYHHYLTCLALPSNWLCPILCNWFIHMFQLDELSPSHWPNPPPPTGHTTDESCGRKHCVNIVCSKFEIY